MGNLIANTNNQVQHHKDFLFNHDKNYIRPIQLQQQSIKSMVKEIRAYLLPRSLDKLIKSKIISAPLLSTSIWNIPPECEKALEEANRKRNQFFVGDVQISDFLLEDKDSPEAPSEVPDLLPKRQVPPNLLASKIKDNISAWKEVVPPRIFNMLNHGIILPLLHKSLLIRQFTTSFPQNKFAKDKLNSLHNIIQETLEMGIISQISNNSKIFPNNIFVVIQEHRTTKNRLIFDMSFLNQFIKFPKFSLLKIPTILHILHRSNFAAKIDLSKAYYHIPIHENYKKFFSFAFKNKKYQFNNMPFGLASAPYIFTTIMTAVIVYIRKTYGIIIFSYLDDILILAKNHFQITYAILKVLELFERLGLTVNYKASILHPTNIVTYLGISFDLTNKTMSLSERNISNIRIKINKILKSSKSSLYNIESIVGSLNFASTYTCEGKNMLHPIINIMNTFYKYTSRDILRKTPTSLKLRLIPWQKREVYYPIPHIVPLPKKTIYKRIKLWMGSHPRGGETSISQKRTVEQKRKITTQKYTGNHSRNKKLYSASIQQT